MVLPGGIGGGGLGSGGDGGRSGGGGAGGGGDGAASTTCVIESSLIDSTVTPSARDALVRLPKSPCHASTVALTRSLLGGRRTRVATTTLPVPALTLELSSAVEVASSPARLR